MSEQFDPELEAIGIRVHRMEQADIEGWATRPVWLLFDAIYLTCGWRPLWREEPPAGLLDDPKSVCTRLAQQYVALGMPFPAAWEKAMQEHDAVSNAWAVRLAGPGQHPEATTFRLLLDDAPVAAISGELQTTEHGSNWWVKPRAWLDWLRMSGHALGEVLTEIERRLPDAGGEYVPTTLEDRILHYLTNHPNKTAKQVHQAIENEHPCEFETVKKKLIAMKDRIDNRRGGGYYVRNAL